MYVCIYVCMYVYIYIYILCVYIYIYTHIHTHITLFVCSLTSITIITYICMYTLAAGQPASHTASERIEHTGFYRFLLIASMSLCVVMCTLRMPRSISASKPSVASFGPSATPHA